MKSTKNIHPVTVTDRWQINRFLYVCACVCARELDYCLCVRVRVSGIVKGIAVARKIPMERRKPEWTVIKSNEFK